VSFIKAIMAQQGILECESFKLIGIAFVLRHHNVIVFC